MSIVYLADGRRIEVAVQRWHEMGTIKFEGCAITVERLPSPFDLYGYGELTHVQIEGQVWGFILRPGEYQQGRATVDMERGTITISRTGKQWDVLENG